MKRSILANREDVRNIEAELQYEFVAFVLESLGIPPEVLIECFPEGGYDEFDVIHKKRLREYLKKFDVEIVDDRDGGIKIYLDDDVVAEWKKAKFALRRDAKARTPAKKVYSEIFIDFWTIFDNEEGEGVDDDEEEE